MNVLHFNLLHVVYVTQALQWRSCNAYVIDVISRLNVNNYLTVKLVESNITLLVSNKSVHYTTGIALNVWLASLLRAC